QHWAHLAGKTRLHRLNSKLPACLAGIVVWIALLQLPNECIQSLLRFFDRQSGLEPSHCAGKTGTSNRRDRKRQSNESCGCPNFHITAKTFTGMTKIRRHHPDDGVAILVQANSFADYVRIAAELSFPQCVTYHDGIQKTRDPICLGVS